MTADDKTAAFLEKFKGPEIMRKDITYSPSQGWSIRKVYADGQQINEGGGDAEIIVNGSKLGGESGPGGHYEIIHLSTPDKLRDEHLLEWRATEHVVLKHVGKLKLEGKSKATYYQWDWCPIAASGREQTGRTCTPARKPRRLYQPVDEVRVA